MRWYPVIPRVLFILTGASRSRLEGRISDLQAMAAQHPLVTALAQEVPLGAAVLEDLEQHGPAQNVWTPLTGGTPAPGPTCNAADRLRRWTGERAPAGGGDGGRRRVTTTGCGHDR